MLGLRAYLEARLHNIPQLLALVIAGVLYLQIASLGHYLLCSEWPLGISPSRVTPPLLYRVDILLEKLLFMVFDSHRDSVYELLASRQGFCWNSRTRDCPKLLAGRNVVGPVVWTGMSGAESQGLDRKREE